ncbi:glycosyltransferase [Actinoplanes sp. NPDC051470]|uniref:glycosyltransferase n=1 Tax=Actinoplanes sp. NPDC051470 TaxID=3157224 RepID=UPI003448F73D
MLTATTVRTKTIDVVYIKAGGGHRAAAVALDVAIREQGRPWRVRLVDLVDILDPQDVVRRITTKRPEEYYNLRLERGWTLGLIRERHVLQAALRMGHRAVVKRMQAHWDASRPDLVVSVAPHFNRQMFDSLQRSRPDTPYVTVLTDFADLPPRYWIEPRQPQHWICGTPRAALQARAAGCDPARVHRTSGMVIHPDFYLDHQVDRAAAMAELGLDPDRPTGMVMFGGHGSKQMRVIAKRLADTQLIFVCGHNSGLADDIRAMDSSAPRVVLGFTSEMRRYMRLCDYFIGKPGPGSISEAISQGLPAIVVRNAWTMHQERYNTEWVQENNVGVVLESYRDIREGVAEVVDNMDAYRVAVGRISNRAVFEIPDLLQSIMGVPQAWPNLTAAV